jgi:hypothetical protein
MPLSEKNTEILNSTNKEIIFIHLETDPIFSEHHPRGKKISPSEKYSFHTENCGIQKIEVLIKSEKIWEGFIPLCDQIEIKASADGKHAILLCKDRELVNLIKFEKANSYSSFSKNFGLTHIIIIVLILLVLASLYYFFTKV